eukprot:1152449-Pelagomonas_calceolata.AAC.1
MEALSLVTFSGVVRIQAFLFVGSAKLPLKATVYTPFYFNSNLISIKRFKQGNAVDTFFDMCTHQAVSASDAVLKLSVLLVETQRHFLLQLSCPCRQ